MFITITSIPYLKLGDSGDEKPTQQERFWNFIKKDNTGLSSLKDKETFIQQPKG